VLVADFDDDDMTGRTQRQTACDLTSKERRMALGGLQVLQIFTARIRNEPRSLPDVEVEARHGEMLTVSGSRSDPVASVVPRLFAKCDASEFGPDGPGRLGTNARKDPLEAIRDRPELVLGGDVVLLQRLPRAPRQTQTFNQTWNELTLSHLADLSARQFNDWTLRSRQQFISLG
jgi:hypothetical protein